jgi:hypothetical protein
LAIVDDTQIVLRDKVERCSEKTGIAVERINIKTLEKDGKVLPRTKRQSDMRRKPLKYD